MATAIKLSDKLVGEAKVSGLALHRSPPKQIEYWAAIGKIAEENPDLPFTFIKGILIGMEEVSAGDVSEYEFG
jgi:hypothetical protein|tara:strand:- start:7644 stop:7862 length:219 start_codon:yes stop_codon:yes gene_type:complete